MANSDATQSTGATLPLGPNPRFVTDHFDTPDIDQIGVYRAYGGYEALAKALTSFQPDELVEEVKKSGLRGRGGAGFGTGMKWGFLPKESPKPRYLCVNGDESEPGTFKDRMIMEVSPHLLVEGVIIASYATKVHHAFIYVRGELLKAGLLHEDVTTISGIGLSAYTREPYLNTEGRLAWRDAPELSGDSTVLRSTSDPFSADGANLNLIIGNDAVDPISGSVPHRAYLCQVRLAD